MVTLSHISDEPHAQNACNCSFKCTLHLISILSYQNSIEFTLSRIQWFPLLILNEYKRFQSQQCPLLQS